MQRQAWPLILLTVRVRDLNEPLTLSITGNSSWLVFRLELCLWVCGWLVEERCAVYFCKAIRLIIFTWQAAKWVETSCRLTLIEGSEPYLDIRISLRTGNGIFWLNLDNTLKKCSEHLRSCIEMILETTYSILLW